MPADRGGLRHGPRPRREHRPVSARDRRQVLVGPCPHAQPRRRAGCRRAATRDRACSRAAARQLPCAPMSGLSRSESRRLHLPPVPQACMIRATRRRCSTRTSTPCTARFTNGSRRSRRRLCECTTRERELRACGGSCPCSCGLTRAPLAPPCARRSEVYVSFGGLLMRLRGDSKHLQKLVLDTRIYLLMRKIVS